MVNEEIKARQMSLCSLPSDPPRKLDVLGHDRDPLGVNGTQVGVLKQADEVSLTCFLRKEYSEVG